MSTVTTFETLNQRVSAGERLSAAEVTQLSSTPDILRVGMLADVLRRRLHGAVVTYVRVAPYRLDGPFDPVPEAAREVRVSGAPARIEDALAAVARVRALAGHRTVSGFSWAEVARLGAADGTSTRRLLASLREAGLDALAELPIDLDGDLTAALEDVRAAGFDRLRLTIDRAPAGERATLVLRAAALQDRIGGIQAVNPLPAVLQPLRPTTGYDDVRAVAVARLAAPNIPTIQVDWSRYGPKLAQVALTFGADDLDAVSAAEASPGEWRRAPLEEVRRNIATAGFTPVERDGRFDAIA
jgi:2-iminoacetate synthase ThiH